MQGSDEHYAELAAVATVSQLRTAVKLEPRPQPEPEPQSEPEPAPEPRASITKTTDEAFSCYRIKLGHTDAAKFDAALQSHRDALIAERKHDHDNGDHDNGDHDNGDHDIPIATMASATMASAAQISGRRCRAAVRRSCGWWSPGGTPRRRAGRTGSTPRWWCIWTSSSASRRCIWVRCSQRTNADI